MPDITELGPASFTVTGVDHHSASLSAAELYNLPQQTINTSDHGSPAIFQGVLLSDVLAIVATPTGEGYAKTAQSHYLVVEGADGYKAVFAWAELDPTFTDRKIYLAVKRDGKPLTPKDGPFQLVVPGEKRNARWVRQVRSLRIEVVSGA